MLRAAVAAAPSAAGAIAAARRPQAWTYGGSRQRRKSPPPPPPPPLKARQPRPLRCWCWRCACACGSRCTRPAQRGRRRAAAAPAAPPCGRPCSRRRRSPLPPRLPSPAPPSRLALCRLVHNGYRRCAGTARAIKGDALLKRGRKLAHEQGAGRRGTAGTGGASKAASSRFDGGLPQADRPVYLSLPDPSLQAPPRRVHCVRRRLPCRRRDGNEGVRMSQWGLQIVVKRTCRRKRRFTAMLQQEPQRGSGGALVLKNAISEAWPAPADHRQIIPPSSLFPAASLGN
jgi:hypothetical protein